MEVLHFSSPYSEVTNKPLKEATVKDAIETQVGSKKIIPITESIFGLILWTSFFKGAVGKGITTKLG